MEFAIPSWLVNFFDKVILAILVGLITSVIFFYILSKFRPKIDISKAIAKGADKKDGRPIYRIKVINRTKYPIIDIKAQLHIFENQQTANGEIWKSMTIELKRSDPIVIDKYDKSDRDALYAYRFVTYNDLEALWGYDNVQFLRFRIYARHALSGFGTFAYQDFRLKRNSIKVGDFSKGDTFEIV